MTDVIRKIKLRHVFLLAASSLVLAACGGGGGGDGGGASPAPAPGAASGSVQGVAAVGAPISLGTITLLGANGETASAPADATGNFHVDTTGLARPILLRVEGVAGGESVIQYSAITPEVGGVLNANPVTTAIVSLVLGTDPGTVFDTADLLAIRRLTDRAVGDASAAIHAAMEPARPGAGMGAGTELDFLTGAFTADKTGPDRMLDLVKVRVEADRSVSVVNKTADAVVRIAPAATADGVPTVSGTLGTVQAIDTAGIDALGARFQQQLADVAANFGGGGTTAARDLFDAGFLDGGENRDDVLAYLAADTFSNGAQLLPARVFNCTGSAPNFVCDATFTVKYADGALEGLGFAVRRQNDGSWRFHGNQAPLGVDVNPVNYRIVSSGGTTTRAGFNVNVEPAGAIVRTEIYMGAGVSGAPVATLSAPGLGNTCTVSYMVTGVGGDCGNFVALSDAQIDGLQASARPKVTLRFLDAGNFQVGQPHTTYLETVPLKPGEVTADRFAVFTEQSWADFVAAAANGTFTLAVAKSAGVGLEDVTNVYPASAGSGTHMPYETVRSGTSFSVKKVAGASSMVAVTRDAAGRAFWFQRQ